MCGIGKRFKDAGYKDHKSMIEINFKNMLERIMDNFKDINLFLITSNSVLETLSQNLKWEKFKKKINLILIDEHNLGPAYSIYKAYDFLPKGEKTYISYCDITWNWLDGDEPTLLETKAAIFCHYGFHPHLVNNNYSAFCKPLGNNEFVLDEIKEKESFTNNWMEEPLSIGLFFVNDVSLIKDCLFQMIQNKDKKSNEYFPSLLFNYLSSDGIKVELIPVSSFVHYGTPSQLNDLENWIEFFKIKKGFNNKNYSNLYKASILTSGKGSRMQSISKKSKAILEILDERLVDMVVNYLPVNHEKVSIIYNNLETPIDSFPASTKYFKIKETNSQFESLLLSINHLKKQKDFFLCSCDCFGFFDEELFRSMILEKVYDVICFGFNPSLLQLKLKTSFSTFIYSERKVKQIFVKEIPQTNHLGLGGFFWIRDGSILSDAILNFSKIKTNLNREIIIDDILSHNCLDNFVIGSIPLKKYVHLGTKEEFNEYLYWNMKIPKLLKNII